MRGIAHLVRVSVLGLTVAGLSGCGMVPRRMLAQSQHRTAQLYQQNRAIAMERDGLMASQQTLTAENQGLKQQVADHESLNQTLKDRLANSQSTEQKLRDQFTSHENSSPLSDAASNAFKDLAEKYKGFDFDPATGVSKFDEDILFESGSAELKPSSGAVLQEFANILNSGAAQELNILVVGHTDDQRVVKPGTKARHPDNWYLSAHRAISVREALSKYGLKENRFGVAGYGPHQPLKPNSNDQARAGNRRVEIFVLAPNASVAGWDGQSTVK